MVYLWCPCSHYASTTNCSSRYGMQGQVLDSKYSCCSGDKWRGCHIQFGECSEVYIAICMFFALLLLFTIIDPQFAKENSKYVEESKLRVIMTSPPHSPTLSPINGVHNEVHAYDTSPLKNQVLHGNKNISPQSTVSQFFVAWGYYSFFFGWINGTLSCEWYFISFGKLFSLVWQEDCS